MTLVYDFALTALHEIVFCWSNRVVSNVVMMSNSTDLASNTYFVTSGVAQAGVAVCYFFGFACYSGMF